jgi:hypothetical protein
MAPTLRINLRSTSSAFPNVIPTPLQVLHKVPATYLKLLAQNPLRLKDFFDFKQRLDSSLNSSFYYHSSLDVQSLYTFYDMRVATRTAFITFKQNPQQLPSNLTSSTLGNLITFCMDNSYLELNASFSSQDEGGTMGSPLIVEIAEIRLAEVDTLALSSSPDPPTSLMTALEPSETETTQKPASPSSTLLLKTSTSPWNTPLLTDPYPSLTSSLLIHPDNSTSIYRKPTHTNLYSKYSSCTTNS